MGLFAKTPASTAAQLQNRPTPTRPDRPNLFGGEAVGGSEDLERILALPSRPKPTQAEQQAMAEKMTALLRRDNPACECAQLRPRPANAPPNWSPCITSLRPIQGWYLHEAMTSGGALGHIVVGGGKTGIDILLAMVIPPRKTKDGRARQVRVVLMVPSNLQRQFGPDYLLWSQHFKVPNLAGTSRVVYPDRPTIDLITYAELSSPGFSTWLKTSRPDAFICDESHRLKDPGSTRTDRLIRYYAESGEDIPEGEFTALPMFTHSGTIIDDKIENVSHISALVLGPRSPFPISPATAVEFGEHLNPTKRGRPPRRSAGALRKLCRMLPNGAAETVHQAFRRRLVETPGVIVSEDAELSTKLVIRKRPLPDLPPILKGLIDHARKEKQRPDGERLPEIGDVIKVCRQLASGFYYIWRYPTGWILRPDGSPEENDDARALIVDEWFSKRSAWNRELSDRMLRRTDMMDSPGLLEAAARRYLDGYQGPLPIWASQTYKAWAEIEPRVRYIKHPVWVDDYVARDAAAYAREAPAVVWSGYEAFGEKVAELTGMPLYASGNEPVTNLNPTTAMLKRREFLIGQGEWRGGDVADNWIQTEDGGRSIICSIKAHGTGKNLQMFERCLVAQPPIMGWEQLLGRHHRPGQLAGAVRVSVYRHTKDIKLAFDDARDLAEGCYALTGKVEKLCFADINVE